MVILRTSIHRHIIPTGPRTGKIPFSLYQRQKHRWVNNLSNNTKNGISILGCNADPRIWARWLMASNLYISFSFANSSMAYLGGMLVWMHVSLQASLLIYHIYQQVQICLDAIGDLLNPFYPREVVLTLSISGTRKFSGNCNHSLNLSSSSLSVSPHSRVLFISYYFWYLGTREYLINYI